jgi:hypothetical protein
MMTDPSFLEKKNFSGLFLSSSSFPSDKQREDQPKAPARAAESRREPNPRDVVRAVRIIAESNGLTPQIERINWSAGAITAAWEMFGPILRRYLNACVKLQIAVDLPGPRGNCTAYLRKLERTAADGTDTVIEAVARGAEILPGSTITTEIAWRAKRELEAKPHILQHFDDEFNPVKRVHIVDRKTRPARVLFLQTFDVGLFKAFAMPSEPDTPRREISWFTYDGSDWDCERGWYVPKAIQRASKAATNDANSPPPTTVNQPSQNSKL